MRNPISLGSLLLLSTAFAPAAAFAQESRQTPADARPTRRTRPTRPGRPASRSRGLGAGRRACPSEDIVVTGRNIPNVVRTHARGGLGAVERGHRPHRRRRHRRRAAARHRPVGGRQRLRLRPRPRRPLFAGAAQRLAAAEPRAAAPGRPARHLPDQRHRQLGRPEELFGQLSGRIRRRRDQPHHHRRSPRRDLPRRSAPASSSTARRPAISATPITAATSTALGFDDGTRDFPPALRAAVAGGTFDADRPPRSAATSPPAWSTPPTTLLQRIRRHRPPTLGGEISAGTAFDLRRRPASACSARPATATPGARRDAIQQTSLDPRARRHAADQLPARSPPTTGSSSTACSASAPSSASTRSAGPTSIIRDTLKQGRLSRRLQPQRLRTRTRTCRRRSSSRTPTGSSAS